jgi:hypothetical protein
MQRHSAASDDEVCEIENLLRSYHTSSIVHVGVTSSTWVKPWFTLASPLALPLVIGVIGVVVLGFGAGAGRGVEERYLVKMQVRMTGKRSTKQSWASTLGREVTPILMRIRQREGRGSC